MVDQALIDLWAGEKPVLHVFSKIDALAPEDLDGLRERVGNLIPNSIL